MSKSFEYTQQVEASHSSFVDYLYYNENDQTLAVELTDEVYKYTGVPRDAFDEFVKVSQDRTQSAGTHYNKVIKPTYGPAENLGFWSQVNFVEVNKQAVTTPTTPKGLNFETAEPTKEFTLRSVPTGPNVTAETVTATKEFSLQTPGARKTAATNGGESYTVVFNEGRTYNPKGVSSVEEAVHALREVAEILNVEVKVNQVVVTFE